MSVDRTEEENNDPVIAMRIAGKRYPEIANALQISEVSARRRVKNAVDRGIVDAQQVRYVRNANAHLASDEAYNAQWIARARSRCIVSPTGCWLWQGCLTATGYSLIGYRHMNRGGHRLMYRAYFGVTLKTEQYVLHKCDVRNCINPDHLWIGSAADNNRDCAAKGRHYEGKKTHCLRGHEFTPENTKLYPTGRGSMSRKCLTCDREKYKRKSA